MTDNCILETMPIIHNEAQYKRFEKAHSKLQQMILKDIDTGILKGCYTFGEIRADFGQLAKQIIVRYSLQ